MLIQNTGVTYQTELVTPGYILLAPAGAKAVYLIDTYGEVVNQWASGGGLTHWSYLLSNGNLFVNERCDDPQGVGLVSSGVMREYDWDGHLIREHIDPWQHHDARRLENGHIIYLAFTDLNADQRAVILGGIAGSEFEPGIMGECIREVDVSGAIVWEWHFTNFNKGEFPIHPNGNRWSRAHTNTVFPLPDNRVLVSCKNLNLLFIVDKQTDAVVWHYQDDKMGGQHDAQILDNDNLLLFANGAYSADLHHSQVWELNPESKQVVWRYQATDNPQSFFSPHIGGCQRLSSGNTLICEGAKGCIFEVTPRGEIVWEYVCPYFNQTENFGRVNWLFRARHYSAGSAELAGRI